MLKQQKPSFLSWQKIIRYCIYFIDKITNHMFVQNKTYGSDLRQMIGNMWEKWKCSIVDIWRSNYFVWLFAMILIANLPAWKVSKLELEFRLILSVPHYNPRYSMIIWNRCRLGNYNIYIQCAVVVIRLSIRAFIRYHDWISVSNLDIDNDDDDVYFK